MHTLSQLITFTILTLSIKPGNYFLSPDLYTVNPNSIPSCQPFETKIEINFDIPKIKQRLNLQTLSGDYAINFLNTALREDINQYYTTKFHKVSNNQFQIHDRIFTLGDAPTETLTVHYDERFFASYTNGHTQSFMSLYGNGNYIYFYPSIEVKVDPLKSINAYFENKKIGQNGCLNIEFETLCALNVNTVINVKIPKKHFSNSAYNTSTFNGCDITLDGISSTSANCDITAENLKITNILSDNTKSQFQLRICNVVTPEPTDGIQLELYHQSFAQSNLFANGKSPAEVESPDFNTSWVSGALLKKNEAYASELVLKTDHLYMAEANSNMVFTFPGVMGFVKKLNVEILDSLTGKVINQEVLDNPDKMYSVQVPHSLFFENGVHVKLSCDETVPDSHDYGYMEILLVDQLGRSVGNAHQLYVQFTD